MKEDDALEDRLVTRQIEKAQRKVEAHNFDLRKHLLDYDDVANDQRKVIYEQRNELLEATDVSETLVGIRNDVVEGICRQHVPENSIDEQWDLPGLERALESDIGIKVDSKRYREGKEEVPASAIWAGVQADVERHFREKEAMVGSDVMRQLERHVLLSVLDGQWKDHLASMDYLRQGIHLRGYAQKQPKQEFKREAFELFQQLLERVKSETIRMLARVRVRSENDLEEAGQQQRRSAPPLQYQHADAGSLGVDDEAAQAQGLAPAGWDASGQGGDHAGQSVRAGAKIGRNDPCPCGSGKKYKSCHGKLD